MMKIPDHTSRNSSAPDRGKNIFFILAMLLALSASFLCGVTIFRSINHVKNILETDLPEIADNYRAMDKIHIRMSRIASGIMALEKQLSSDPAVIHAAGAAVGHELDLLLKDAEKNNLTAEITQIEVILGRYENLIKSMLADLSRINHKFTNLTALAENLRQEIRETGRQKTADRFLRKQMILDLDYALLLARRGVLTLAPDLVDPGLQPGEKNDSTRTRLMTLSEEIHRLRPRSANAAIDHKTLGLMLNNAEDLAAAIKNALFHSDLLLRTATPLTKATSRFDSSLPNRILALRVKSEQHLTWALYIGLALFISLLAAMGLAQLSAVLLSRRRRMKTDRLAHLVIRLRQQKEQLEDQQRRLKQELEQSLENSETWRDLFENASDLIQILSPDGHFLQTNRAWHRILGYNDQDIKSLTIFDIIHPDCQAHCMKVFSSMGPGDLLLNTTLVAKDGTRVEVEGHANLRIEDGRPVSTRCILRDVTAQHKIENEAAKAIRLEGLALMTGGLAHDFNNLLTAVTGNLSLIKIYGCDNKKLSAKVEQTEKAIGRARDMISRLLDFSRIEEPRIRHTDLSTVIREAAEIIAADNNCELSWQMDSDLPEVYADPGQIGQVIQNIVGNAAQAMDGGRIEISAHAAVIGPDNQDIPILPGIYLKIEIRDFGPGLPPEKLEHIFEPYFTTKEGGRGLGLAISYAMIRKHQGLLIAENHPDGGAAFRIFLPLTRATATDGADT